MPTKDEVLERLRNVDPGTAITVGGSALAGIGAARAAKAPALKDWHKKSKGLRQQIGQAVFDRRDAVKKIQEVKGNIKPEMRDRFRQGMRDHSAKIKGLTQQYAKGKRGHMLGRQVGAGLGVAALTAGASALVRRHQQQTRGE